MNKYQAARDVLVKSRDEVLRELIICGQNGGTGRAGAYAPQLVNLQGAIDAIDRMDVDTPKADRMAEVRAAKTAKQ
jgi:hypothetical protein